MLGAEGIHVCFAACAGQAGFAACDAFLQVQHAAQVTCYKVWFKTRKGWATEEQGKGSAVPDPCNTMHFPQLESVMSGPFSATVGSPG